MSIPKDVDCLLKNCEKKEKQIRELKEWYKFFNDEREHRIIRVKRWIKTKYEEKEKIQESLDHQIKTECKETTSLEKLKSVLKSVAEPIKLEQMFKNLEYWRTELKELEGERKEKIEEIKKYIDGKEKKLKCWRNDFYSYCNFKRPIDCSPY